MASLVHSISFGFKNGNYSGTRSLFTESHSGTSSLLLRLTPNPTLSLHRRNIRVRAAETDTNPVEPTTPEKAPVKNEGSSNLNQLLGIKGAAQETDKLKIRLQLTKPVTWAPLIWGVVCGAASSGAGIKLYFSWDPNLFSLHSF